MITAKEAQEKAKLSRAATLNGTLVDINKAIEKAVSNGRTMANFCPSGYLTSEELKEIKSLLEQYGYTVLLCDDRNSYYIEIKWEV